MGLHIGLIRLDQLGCVLDHQQILSVLLLGRLREVERARDDGRTVDDDHLIMVDRVLIIDEGLDAYVDQEGHGAVFRRLMGFVEHDENLDAALMDVL